MTTKETRGDRFILIQNFIASKSGVSCVASSFTILAAVKGELRVGSMDAMDRAERLVKPVKNRDTMEGL